jgi:hypothetical protein
MTTTGLNYLNFPTGKNITYFFEPFSEIDKNYILSIEGDKKFELKFSGNYIYDYDNNLIDYFRASKKIQFSGNFYDGQYYDLFYNGNPLALKKQASYNYIEKISVNSFLNQLDYSLVLKIKKPNIQISLPQKYLNNSIITGNIFVDNNSFKIYSGSISDITPNTYPQEFELFNLNQSNNYIYINTTGVTQRDEFKTYNLNLSLDTNIGELTQQITLTGENSPLSQDIYISKLSEIQAIDQLSSGEVIYIIYSNFLSGSSLTEKNINISFSYYSGFTGNKITNIIGTGDHYITYTGNISGTGLLYTNPNTLYSATGYDQINLTNLTGNISYNDTDYYEHTGGFQNSFNILGTGLVNKTLKLEKNIFATGSTIESAIGSGILNGSGFLSGIKNNLTSIGKSDHLVSKSMFFPILKTPAISIVDVSGKVGTGYIEEYNYFTGINDNSIVGSYSSTGFLTGKNETFYIYSGNNISGNFTGNLSGSGYLTVVPNFNSPFQNFTGYLSGDLSNRSISISLPFSGGYVYDYFTGYNDKEITLNIIGSALGYDSLNSGAPVVATVTGYKTFKTGINFESIHSGSRYLVINDNFINQDSVSLAKYELNNFSDAGLSSSRYISNIFSNKLKTVLMNTSFYAYQNGLQNFVDIYTGFNNNWTKIWSINTGWAGPVYFISPQLDPKVFGAKITSDYSGNNIIIGCDRCDDQYPSSLYQGQVFTYTRNNNQIITGSKITLSSPYNSYKSKSRFGYDVDINNSGNLMIVGAPYYRYCIGLNNSLIFDCNETSVHPYDLGAAFLYRKEANGTWSLETSLHPSGFSNLNYSANFGTSVAINNSGNLVAITSLNENGDNSGSLYVYEKNQNTWQLSHKISGIRCGGKKVEFSKESNILAFQSGIPKEWNQKWAYVNDGISPIDSIAIIENQNGIWKTLNTIFTGDSSSINNFTITSSQKLVILHSGQRKDPTNSPITNSLNLSGPFGPGLYRADGSLGFFVDFYSIPGRRYELQGKTNLSDPYALWHSSAIINSATGFFSSFYIPGNATSPAPYWKVYNSYEETNPKFLIYDISGNYQAEITGNFNTIDDKDSFFVSNDLTNLILSSSSKLTGIKNLKANFSHLNLKSTSLAYSKITDWTPISNFANLPNTYTLIGTGNISKNITKNLSNLSIGNKELLKVFSGNNVNQTKIQEIESKMFTGIWSGIGSSNKINKNLTYNFIDSGKKNINNEIQYSNPYIFYPLNTLDISGYSSEIKTYGQFSGIFSGDVMGTGYMQKQISGMSTGFFGSGEYVTGLDFTSGLFAAQISGTALNGYYYNNLNLTGFDQNFQTLTGFKNEFIVTGSVTKIKQLKITGFLPTFLTYVKTFKNSFTDIFTGYTYHNMENSLFYNNINYTGNLYNLTGDSTLFLKIKKQKLYDDDQISGVFNIKIYNPTNELNFVTGAIYEYV